MVTRLESTQNVTLSEESTHGVLLRGHVSSSSSVTWMFMRFDMQLRYSSVLLGRPHTRVASERAALQSEYDIASRRYLHTCDFFFRCARICCVAFRMMSIILHPVHDKSGTAAGLCVQL